jgi:von Willebrand factor type A domain.
MLFRKFLEKFRLPRLLNSLIHDRSGNFGIMTALLVPVLAGAAGVAIDVSSALAVKNQMAGAADAGALAAAAALGEKKMNAEQAKELAVSYVLAQVASLGSNPDDYKVDVDIKTTTSGKKKAFDVSVAVNGEMPTTLTRIMGFETIPISVAGVATSGIGSQSSMSMYLVLDRSGSMLASVTSSIKSTTAACDYNYFVLQVIMLTKSNHRPCYYQRMEILKQAVDRLMNSLADADPEMHFIRTGAVAFSSEKFPPENLVWGVEKVRSYVKRLESDGGTSSTDAFEEAVNALIKQSENSQHIGKNGLVPNKYIVFMTDGENNESRDNRDTQTLCTKAKDAGIIVYSVGFMLTTSTAKNLLKSCASSEKTYFDAQDGDKLTAAFAAIATQTAGATPRLTH